MFSIFSSKKKKKTLMFVDDDKNILSMYRQIFSMNDEYEVITVDNKSDFLSQVSEADVVISDYHMKEITDINFANVLDVCEKKEIPLLLLTGDIYPYYDYQLSKPVSPKSLKVQIEKMLERGYVPSKKKPPKSRSAA